MSEPQPSPKHAVVLANATAYDAAAEIAAGMLDFLDIPLAPGDRVLVKPNLLRADVPTCSNAILVAGVCRYLKDRGCAVTVGDSPGFGTAKGVAAAIGLDAALRNAGCADVPLITLDSPVKRPLSLGGSIGISRHALDADHILNIPKLKAHSQMRVTGSVKNLFGCVSGARKALAHTLYGDKERDGVRAFPSLIADILDHLPPVTTLMDAVTAMHVRGPSGGREFPASLLAAGAAPAAVDTAVYSMLGVTPGDIPLWLELQRRKTPGAFLEDVMLCGEHPGTFDLSAFKLPETLSGESFNPVRLMVSTIKRLWARSCFSGSLLSK